jgi:hypothetical protein
MHGTIQKSINSEAHQKNMNSVFRMTLFYALVLPIVTATSSPVFAQQGAASGPPLVIHTESLPRGYLHQPYHAQLEASGGILPLTWDLTDGKLPRGTTLNPDGTLTGAPDETGEFKFTVTVHDSGRPAVQLKKPLVLVVVAPLLAKWGKYPTVNGHRIEGTILVSNQTEQDFDLTTIVLAVADNGRATAIGYQHFPLKKGTDEFEIPFGGDLPYGPYQVHADVVAEVPTTYSIYRAHLTPNEPLTIQQEP